MALHCSRHHFWSMTEALVVNTEGFVMGFEGEVINHVWSCCKLAAKEKQDVFA